MHNSVLSRLIRPSDATLKQHLFFSLSKDAVAKRYLGSLKAMPLKRIWPYVIVDYGSEMVLVRTIMKQCKESIIAIGCYLHILNSDPAEIAMKYGIVGFTACVLTSNSKMIRIFKKSSSSMKYRIEGDLYQIEIEFGKQSKLKN